MSKEVYYSVSQSERQSVNQLVNQSVNLSVSQSIQLNERDYIICPETDPQWRLAILNHAPRLFSFRQLHRGASGSGGHSGSGSQDRLDGGEERVGERERQTD